MKAQSVKMFPPKLPTPLNINAKFRDRLPYLVNDMCRELMAIEPPLERLQVYLSEFIDYLDFEIKKLELDIEKMKWESRFIPEARKEAEDWLQKLKQLKSDFDLDVLAPSPDALNDTIMRINKIFDVL
jgi:hypothetical protein